MLKLILIILCATLLQSCGNPPVAGGTGSETTNSFAGIVLTSQGIPAEHATVYLIDQSRWFDRIDSGKSPVVDSVKTDSAGQFVITSEGAGTYAVQVSGEGESFWQGGFPVSESTEIHAGTIRLETSMTVRGIVSGSASEVRPLFTANRSSIKNDGSFYIEQIPAGIFALFADRELCGGFEGVRGDTIDLGTLSSEPNTLIIDDFRFSNVRSALSWIVPGANWGLRYSKNTLITPTADSLDFSPLISKTDGFDGRSLNMTIRSSNLDTASAHLTCPVARKGTLTDLSSLKSVSLTAKGTGSITISLNCGAFGDQKLSAEIALPLEWTDLQINQNQFVSPDGSTEQRTSLLKSVQSISLKLSAPPNDSVRVQADNLALEGCGARLFIE